MKKKPQRKLLVPVNGSDRSLNMVRYIMKIADINDRNQVSCVRIFSDTLN
jgi:hypothetical protein